MTKCKHDIISVTEGGPNTSIGCLVKCKKCLKLWEERYEKWVEVTRCF